MNQNIKITPFLCFENMLFWHILGVLGFIPIIFWNWNGLGMLFGMWFYR